MGSVNCCVAQLKYFAGLKYFSHLRQIDHRINQWQKQFVIKLIERLGIGMIKYTPMPNCNERKGMSSSVNDLTLKNLFDCFKMTISIFFIRL